MHLATRPWTTGLIRSGLIALATALGLSPSAYADCRGADNIRLLEPVEISAQLRAELQAMPPLKAVSLSAPPMARYDEDRQSYDGIGTDILCFITRELGMRFELPPDREMTVKDKIQRVQDGKADLFVMLSHTDERAKRGLFTLPYYESHYAVIARRGRSIAMNGIPDLAKYRVGYVQGVALEPILQAALPASQLRAYDLNTSDGLFEAIQSGEIDVAVFNKDIFIEKRYHQEYFDLQIVHTLLKHPRPYRFYFSRSPGHQQLVEVFDRYLAVMDTSASIMKHEDGERIFFERYVKQQHQKVLLQAASVATALLALLFYLALRRYRHLSNLLGERNACIQRQQRELQQAYQKLETLSLTDDLTLLANRRHFDQSLSYEYARYQRTGSPLSLLLIDVDHFKLVNDHYGHAAGDEYLQAVARILKRSAPRSTDLVARYGGEEFACLLTDTSAENARKVAERIMRGIAEQAMPNALAMPPRLTLSIGIATVVAGYPGTAALFDQADAQLYAAKQSGRNRICATIISR